ncbi:MAG: hypothetical protein HYW49_00380, partial [Deltaproteobacteria bacterium]|nr:hypothetical protein [Deltaproteobacteria bacterium]
AAADRLPADVKSKHWDSAASRIEDFEIERKTLGAAELIEPVGVLLPPATGKLLFRWRKVEGAEGYEVRVRSVKLRTPAAATEAAEKTFVVNETSTELPVAAEGQYRWEVRPLANTDSHGAAGAIGPKSAADFDLNRNAKFAEGAGYIAVSTLISPYNYRVVSPASGFNGTTDSLALAMRLSAEYFPKPQWGLGTAVENTSFKILGTSYSRVGFELTARYRLKLDDAQNGWLLYPKAGLEGRQYFEIYPDTSVAVSAAGGTIAVKEISMLTAGPMAGFDLRKQFSGTFSLGLKFSYFMPLTVLSGGDVQALSSGGASARNLSAGLQGLYWMGPRWALGLGAYLENRSIAFTRKGTASTRPEEIYMDATYFFGSLIYTFGK